MAKQLPAKLTVETFKHDDATRKDIPAQEKLHLKVLFDDLLYLPCVQG